jgi:hypothetical protein
VFLKEDDATFSHVLYKSAKVLNKVGIKWNDIEIPETYKKLRLALTPNDFHRQILLGFHEWKKTTAIDAGIWCIKYWWLQMICTVNNDNQLVIQGEGYW